MCVFNLFLTVLCFRISVTYSAPLQLQYLQSYQSVLMQQQQNIQQQLLELQAMQEINQISAPIAMNNPSPPMLLFLPEHQTNTKIEEKQQTNDSIQNGLKLRKHIMKSKDDDLDSVVIDAEPVPIIEEQKAILLIPNGRLSIGGLISAIPFLPIEINVPDTISWAYNGIANGISSIISIIGQRLPFQGPQTNTDTEGMNLKTMINSLQMKKEQDSVMRPIILMPLEHFRTPMLPIQL